MLKNFLLFPLGMASSALAAFRLPQFSNANKKSLLQVPLALITLAQIKAQAKMSNIVPILKRIEQNKPTGVKRFIIYTVRFIQLGLIFLPSILLLPLALFSSTKHIWMNCFVWSVSKAGVVWIKVFQHMSHRGDVIGDDLAQSFQTLRSFSPEHSYKETEEIFRRVYDETPEVFFDYINPVPIASGSISQVYQANFRGKKVAVKVRHPHIQKNIQKDIAIVFGVSRFLSLFSLFFQIPINQDSFREKLIEQLDFTQQQRNLDKFNLIFTNPEVTFPEPFYESTEEVLIMTFMPGQTMTEFEKHYNKKIRSYVARVGASAFFQMLFQHNFIHVDCHGGNIMVKINKDYSIWTELRDYYRIFKSIAWSFVIKLFLNTQYLKFLARQHTKDDLSLRLQLMSERASVQVALIDVGMVIKLEERKRKYFLNVLSEVIEANPKKCAEMIYGISTFRGQPLKPDQFPKYLHDLEEMFKIVEGKDLKDIKGLDMLKGMLRVIRAHRMKLDGEFATLLTNMLALEGIAKKLDPEINIMRCAVPYLPYKSNPLPP